MARTHRSLGEILKEVLPAASRGRIYSLDFVRLKWMAVVGQEIALRSEPASLSGGILTVRVSDAAWGRMILSLQKEILSRLSIAVGPGVVRYLQFVRDGKPLWEGKSPPFPGCRPIAPPEGVEPVKPSEAVVEAVKAISDPALREQLTRTVSRYLTAQLVRRSR